jgi:hypothetical protein
MYNYELLYMNFFIIDIINNYTQYVHFPSVHKVHSYTRVSSNPVPVPQQFSHRTNIVVAVPSSNASFTCRLPLHAKHTVFT